jgi:hypothetical protein
MEMPKILPKYTDAKLSKAGWINKEDLKKIGKNALVFLTPTLTLYGAQLLGALNTSTILSLKDLIPSPYVIGAFEGYLIATFLDYLKKLNDGGK